MKVAVTGSSGLIGSALTASLRADGHQVVRLVRRPPRGGGAGQQAAATATSEVRWDPRAADAGDPPLAGVDAVVHLAGAGVGDHRWTAAYKAEIRASRVLATRALASALAAAEPRPRAFIAASAIGWYGDTGGREVTEAAPAGKAFLSRVVHDWEAAADPARDAGIRVAHLRSGLVLGAGGGMLGQARAARQARRPPPLRRRPPGDAAGSRSPTRSAPSASCSTATARRCGPARTTSPRPTRSPTAS